MHGQHASTPCASICEIMVQFMLHLQILVLLPVSLMLLQLLPLLGRPQTFQPLIQRLRRHGRSHHWPAAGGC